MTAAEDFQETTGSRSEPSRPAAKSGQPSRPTLSVFLSRNDSAEDAIVPIDDCNIRL